MTHTTEHTLYYIHDPMCSWCWGFRPTWTRIQEALTTSELSITIDYIVGGLAPDSDEPMPEATQQMLQSTWQRIQNTIPGTTFNYDFWTQCQPRRSTYPACRAVLAAKAQNPSSEQAMISAIQEAYYLNARNPSNIDTLTDCASRIGLNTQQFTDDITSDAIEQQLQHHIQRYQQLAQQTGASGFPSLVLHHHHTGQHLSIPINYTDPEISIELIVKNCS